MASDIDEPINLGSSELVTINQLVDIAEDIARIKLKRNYNLGAPKGVNGRNSDNTLIQEKLNWAPSIKLREGRAKTVQERTNDSTRSKRALIQPAMAVFILLPRPARA